MNKSFVLSGCFFGDEGKGTFCDYLSNKYNIKENVRYNGGSQASHTVIVGDITHKFSQLGSSLLNDNTKTYLSDNTIVNPFNIVTEAKFLSNKLNINAEKLIKKIYIDKNALVVTPYHSLINKIRELSNTNNRLGSVGTGVSEVKRLEELIGFNLSINDILTKELDILKDLFDYTKEFVQENKSKINPKLFEKLISEKDLYYLTDIRNREYMIKCYENLIDSDLFNITSNINEFHDENKRILFEGSQGLLIDKNYGIKPNTTYLDTTNHYGIKLSNKLNEEYKLIGCMSSFMSRHGYGVIPTYDENLQKIIHDENQLYSYYQSFPRYGWFDCILARYSLKMNNQDEIFLSQIDRLQYLDKLKICDSYCYIGEIDKEFEKTFDYYEENNRVIIKNIKENNINLRKYLSKCIPLYITLDGFDKNISNIDDYYYLPSNCKKYISLIETLIDKPITVVSVGPSRNQKLERKTI